MEIMKALVYKDIGKAQIEELPVPSVTNPDDVLIKVAMCGCL